MNQLDYTRRFHLIARRRDDNQDEVLFEFNDEWNFHYFVSQVDKDMYKEVIILEAHDGMYPINRFSMDIPDYTPYFRREHGNIKRLIR